MDLLTVLNNFNINGKIISTTQGPLLNIIEFEPALGTKIKTITNLTEDIRRELGVSSLIIEPSKTSKSILFQYPKDEMDIISFLDIIGSTKFNYAKEEYILPILLGVNIKAEPIFADLTKMPHLLVGGTTGSGKSVGLNTFILSLILAKRSSELKLILIDPKKIEFSIYNNQEYLYCPVVTENNEAIDVLSHLTTLMDERYTLFSKKFCKNLEDYNQKSTQKLPYIVCVIDEFADLVSVNSKVQNDVVRLAQKARAAGIHLILATQRPSVDVVSGVLKANFPTRLAYKVASSTDSRTILDQTGAENLISRGDCYYLASNGDLTRLHGAYIKDEAIKQMLLPFQCYVKPLQIKTDKQTSPQSSEPKNVPMILIRFANFWQKLSQKDRKMILNLTKKLIVFLINLIKKLLSKIK